MRALIAAVALVALAGPADAQTELTAAPLVSPFSGGRPGAMPPGWSVMRLSERKHPTAYALVEDHGKTVLHAHAANAASLLVHPIVFDVRATPIVEWRWKIARLIENADNRRAGSDDAPARIAFGFDGDKSRLSFIDRAVFALAKQFSGHDLPYATLMYIWSKDLPVGTVVPNPNTKRVQVIVGASGPEGVGTWKSLRRNVVEDFKRAFGEEPGQLSAVGVFTDTDNTDEIADAWYGDIRFVPNAH